MSKIALFGGSFNPPHKGHLKIALSLIRQARFDEVWFMPTVVTPLKDATLVPFTHRVNMIQRLISPYRKLKICTIESELSLPNYTINTITALQARYPQHRFSMIIGSDQSTQFDRWKDSDILLDKVPFLVVRRDPNDAIHPRMIPFDVPGIDQLSSTHVRHGKLNETSPAVVRYMIENGLYLESLARSMVSESRWTHVKQVAALADELGQIHHCDPHQIKVAALFHDCTKSWLKKTHEAWLGFVNPDYLTEPSPIWHQKTGAAYMKRVLQIRDKAILNAVAHHSTAQKGHPITQILYIADKCEPSRDYDVSEELALAKLDLDKAAALVTQRQAEYLEKEFHAR